MSQVSSHGKIAAGFAAWMQVQERASSKTIEFGNWWRLDTSYWRVSWIENTNELYAVESGDTDRFILLTHLDRKEMNDLRKKWFDGDNLTALLRRFEIVSS